MTTSPTDPCTVKIKIQPKKISHQDIKKAFARESNESETEENNYETETFSAVRTLTKQLLKIVITILLVRQTTTLKGPRKKLFTMMIQIRIFPNSKILIMCWKRAVLKLSQFVEEIFENHIKSKRKGDSDLSH